MPLLFVISGRWKDLFNLVKKNAAPELQIKEMLSGRVRHAAAMAVDVSPRRFLQQPALNGPPPRVQEALTYLGQRFAHRALPKPSL